MFRLAYFPNAGNYASVPTRGGKQDDYVSDDNTMLVEFIRNSSKDALVKYACESYTSI